MTYHRKYMRNKHMHLTTVSTVYQHSQQASDKHYESTSDDTDSENFARHFDHKSRTAKNITSPNDCYTNEHGSVDERSVFEKDHADLSHTDDENSPYEVPETSNENRIPTSSCSSAETDPDESEDNDDPSLRGDAFKEKLRNCVQLCNIPLNHVDKLLVLLRTELPEMNLPKTAQTLLKTKSLISIKKSGMDCLFRG